MKPQIYESTKSRNFPQTTTIGIHEEKILHSKQLQTAPIPMDTGNGSQHYRWWVGEVDRMGVIIHSGLPCLKSTTLFA